MTVTVRRLSSPFIYYATWDKKHSLMTKATTRRDYCMTWRNLWLLVPLSLIVFGILEQQGYVGIVRSDRRDQERQLMKITKRREAKEGHSPRRTTYQIRYPVAGRVWITPVLASWRPETGLKSSSLMLITLRLHQCLIKLRVVLLSSTKQSAGRLRIVL